MGPGGDYEHICPVAAEFGSPNQQTLCILPGTYSVPCEVNAHLVGVEGYTATVIDGDLVTRLGFLWGLSVYGRLEAGIRDQRGPSIFDSFVMGSLVVHGSDDSGGAFIIGNEIHGNVTARDRVLLRRNRIMNGGIRGTGDSGGPHTFIENTISLAGVAINLDGNSLGTHLLRNRIDNCDTGIIFSPSHHGPPRPDIEQNVIRDCRIGIQMSDGIGFGRPSARNNIIVNARDYGILVPHGITYDIAQNLIIGTGSNPNAPDLGIGISASGQYGPVLIGHNTIAGNKNGMNVTWITNDRPGPGGALSSNVVAFSSLNGVALDIIGEGIVTAFNNDVYGNDTDWLAYDDPTGIDGNISADPLFVDPPTGLLGLRPGSPCIDVGAASPLPVDIAGSARTVDGDGDGTALADIGAYELVPANPRGAGFWKHQCSEKPFRSLTAGELEQLFATVAESSPAFPECATIGCALFVTGGPQNKMRPKVEKELAGVWLNVATGHLGFDTPIELESMTSARTVG